MASSGFQLVASLLQGGHFSLVQFRTPKSSYRTSSILKKKIHVYCSYTTHFTHSEIKVLFLVTGMVQLNGNLGYFYWKCKYSIPLKIFYLSKFKIHHSILRTSEIHLRFCTFSSKRYVLKKKRCTLIGSTPVTRKSTVWCLPFFDSPMAAFDLLLRTCLATQTHIHMILIKQLLFICVLFKAHTSNYQDYKTDLSDSLLDGGAELMYSAYKNMGLEVYACQRKHFEQLSWTQNTSDSSSPLI